jgi:hypothetical protein
MTVQAKAYFAWVSGLDVEFDPVLHKRLDLEIQSFALSQAEGEVCRLSVTALNPGIGLLAPGRPQYGYLSVSIDGSAPTLMFRGIVNSMPTDLEEALVTIEFYAKPDGMDSTPDVDGKLELFAKSLSFRPYVEPLISGDTYRSPETVLNARSATYYIDPITHELSLNDLLDWQRLIDLGPMHDRERFSVTMVAPPLGSVTVTGVAEWTQESHGVVDIADAVNSPVEGVGGLKSFSQLDALAESFDIRDVEGQSGWSVANVEHTGLQATQTQRKWKTGNFERVLLQKRIGYNSGGEPIYHNWIDTRWEVIPMSMYQFEAKKFEMAYQYSQPRREVLKVKLNADIQDIKMFGWKEEELQDINLDSLVSDPSEPWMENTQYYVGDRVVKKDKSWICQIDHDSGYDPFQKVLPQYESVPSWLRKQDMYRWKWVPKDAPMRDKRSATFYGLPRGREVAAHLVLRARALLRKRMRCLEATINGRWEDLADVTLKDAIRIEHEYFQTEDNLATGKVIAFTKTWDGPSQTYAVDVTIGISAANGYSDLPPVDNGVGYSPAFDGYAYPDDADITTEVTDVQFTVGGDAIRQPVNPYKLGDSAYSCIRVGYDMAYDKQLAIASRAEAMGRDPRKAAEENPTTFEIEMRAIDGLDLITRVMNITSTIVQGPQGIDLKWSG